MLDDFDARKERVFSSPAKPINTPYVPEYDDDIKLEHIYAARTHTLVVFPSTEAICLHKNGDIWC